LLTPKKLEKRALPRQKSAEVRGLNKRCLAVGFF
jgi:hypothetical protein